MSFFNAELIEHGAQVGRHHVKGQLACAAFGVARAAVGHGEHAEIRREIRQAAVHAVHVGFIAADEHERFFARVAVTGVFQRGVAADDEAGFKRLCRLLRRPGADAQRQKQSQRGQNGYGLFHAKNLLSFCS